jgi:hypothetical protein
LFGRWCEIFLHVFGARVEPPIGPGRVKAAGLGRALRALLAAVLQELIQGRQIVPMQPSSSQTIGTISLGLEIDRAQCDRVAWQGCDLRSKRKFRWTCGRQLVMSR